MTAQLDRYQLEYHAVRLRNRLFFRLGPKGDRRRRKYFIIGHPRTGTQTLHRLFLANDIRSLHSAGNWNTRTFDAFSDRGNYQPYDLFDRYYEDAVFILNTRPAYRYIKSRMNQTAKSHRNKRTGESRVRFTTENIRNAIVSRNRYFLDVLRYFRGRDNLVVVNIERPGALAFLCDALDLHYPGEILSNHKARQLLSETEIANIDRAFDSLDVGESRMNPLLIPELLTNEEADMAEDVLAAKQSSVFL